MSDNNDKELADLREELNREIEIEKMLEDIKNPIVRAYLPIGKILNKKGYFEIEGNLGCFISNIMILENIAKNCDEAKKKRVIEYIASIKEDIANMPNEEINQFLADIMVNAMIFV